MPSGWDVYYIVFVSSFLALGIPAGLWIVSLLVGGKKPAEKAIAERSRGGERQDAVLGRRMNARFFLAANAALVLITLTLALIPCAGALQPGASDSELWRALISIATISSLSALGLLYSSRKGDLGWLRTFQKKEYLGSGEE